MSQGYSNVASPGVMEQLTTTNRPWPGHEGNPKLLSRQGMIEHMFFEKGATVNFDNIPPLQFWAPLVGNTELLVRVNFVVTTLVKVSKVARRPLTADEIELTSGLAASSARWYPLISLSAISTALAFTWKGRHNYQFPFYTPRPKWNPALFPLKSLPLLRGPAAMYAWHAVRLGLYGFMCYLGFSPLGSSLANVSFEAHLLREPRLRNLQQDIMKNVSALRAAADAQKGPGAGIPRPQQGLPPYQSPRSQGASNPENQVSPDFGRDAYNEQPTHSFDKPATGLSRDTMSPDSQPSWPQNTPLPASSYSVQGSKFPNSSPRSVDDSDPFDDDDGSPVPASVRRAEAQRAQSAQSGSAWDRIRKQSQPTNSSRQEGGWAQLRQDKAPNPRESQPKTEGFAYTKYDEDKEKRNYEKEQAQREFDALLEAERRGGSGGR
ncbi:hypothetical protein F4805DRAFT_150937 [Annulohypoxylon moriforme]|nr:hypothetical protein F4805DRAFT_150937 [Annulohypoxylon moriforme]